jgi:hypothetical protein
MMFSARQSKASITGGNGGRIGSSPMCFDKLCQVVAPLDQRAKLVFTDGLSWF